jgi:branched-subunit amino acid aminotransferase/4-amino-4-deoxychorismate lyase
MPMEKLPFSVPDKNAIRFNKSAERLCMPALPEEIFLQSMAAVVDLDRDWVPQNQTTLYIFVRLCSLPILTWA